MKTYLIDKFTDEEVKAIKKEMAERLKDMVFMHDIESEVSKVIEGWRRIAFTEMDPFRIRFDVDLKFIGGDLIQIVGNCRRKAAKPEDTE